MSIMVNTQHDAASYESCSYQRAVYDGNALYEAFTKARKASGWKPNTQKFEMDYLIELSQLQYEIENDEFEFSPASEFTLRERGKPRVVSSEIIRDKVVKHSICDEVLNPQIQPYLIHDNGASIKDKGTGFTRRRLVQHLRRYYYENGSNEGYILTVDFSKYFDNIQHDHLMSLFRSHVNDELTLKLIQQILNKARVDVSYMTDEEYEHCMDTLFDSLQYQQIDKSLLTGEKFMSKRLYLGDQVSQTAGVTYPLPIDNYIKIVKGVKFYGRYNDDSYVIHKDKEFLLDLMEDIVAIAEVLGITINPRKIHIYKLSDKWRFLQIQYSLTETGRIMQKINPKRLTAMRRKMKKLVHILSPEEFRDWYQSWYKGNKKYLSKQQRDNINVLFNELVERRQMECIQLN